MVLSLFTIIKKVVRRVLALLFLPLPLVTPCTQCRVVVQYSKATSMPRTKCVGKKLFFPVPVTQNFLAAAKTQRYFSHTKHSTGNEKRGRGREEEEGATKNPKGNTIISPSLLTCELAKNFSRQTRLNPPFLLPSTGTTPLIPLFCSSTHPADRGGTLMIPPKPYIVCTVHTLYSMKGE